MSDNPTTSVFPLPPNKAAILDSYISSASIAAGLHESTSYQSNLQPTLKPSSTIVGASRNQVFRTFRVGPKDQLEGQLFDSKANAKAISASLSMHLPADWRTKIYRQLDELLDIAEWNIKDRLLNQETVRTFLRYVIYAGIKTVPSLGVSNAGNIITAWHQLGQKISIEFLAGDKCRLVLADTIGDERSVITFAGTVVKAREFLRGQFSIS